MTDVQDPDDAPKRTRLGREILLLRAARDWTQKYAAGRLGCSQTTLSDIELGEISPRPPMIDTICELYKVDRNKRDLLHLLGARAAGWKIKTDVSDEDVKP